MLSQNTLDATKCISLSPLASKSCPSCLGVIKARFSGIALPGLMTTSTTKVIDKVKYKVTKIFPGIHSSDPEQINRFALEVQNRLDAKLCIKGKRSYTMWYAAMERTGCFSLRIINIGRKDASEVRDRFCLEKMIELSKYLTRSDIRGKVKFPINGPEFLMSKTELQCASLLNRVVLDLIDGQHKINFNVELAKIRKGDLSSNFKVFDVFNQSVYIYLTNMALRSLKKGVCFEGYFHSSNVFRVPYGKIVTVTNVPKVELPRIQLTDCSCGNPYSIDERESHMEKYHKIEVEVIKVTP